MGHLECAELVLVRVGDDARGWLGSGPSGPVQCTGPNWRFERDFTTMDKADQGHSVPITKGASKLNLSILGFLLVSTWVFLSAQPPDAADWRIRQMEVPGLLLAISSDKTAIKKDETVQLSVKLQYSGNDKVLIEKPDSNLLWLFHPEVKVPLPASIPFARTALPTPEGVRLLRSAEPFTKK